MIGKCGYFHLHSSDFADTDKLFSKIELIFRENWYFLLYGRLKKISTNVTRNTLGDRVERTVSKFADHSLTVH